MAAQALARPREAGPEVPDASAPRNQELKLILHRKLPERFDLEGLSFLKPESAQPEIRAALEKLLDEERTPLDCAQKIRIVEEMLSEVFGLGPLEPLLADPSISNILVTTARLVFIERDGKLFRAPVEFKDDTHLLRIMEKVVSRVGRRLDQSTPMVEARLPDGSRVNAVIPPVAIDGPLLSIRRFRKDKLESRELLANLTLTSEMMALLEAAVGARLNIVVSGGAGSGKTTLLNVLAGFIGPNERIVTVEDAAELDLRQLHVARLETRPANIEGQGAIRQSDLLANALRMRPDRVVVGEVRGAEVLDMLHAMNTGNSGMLTTVHANSPRDAIGRFEAMVSAANPNMPVKAIRQQAGSALHLFVHIERLADGARRVTHMTECTGLEGETLMLQDVFRFEPTGNGAGGRVLGKFRPTGIRPRFNERLKAYGLAMPPEIFEKSTEVR